VEFAKYCDPHHKEKYVGERNRDVNCGNTWNFSKKNDAWYKMRDDAIAGMLTDSDDLQCAKPQTVPWLMPLYYIMCGG